MVLCLYMESNIIRDQFNSHSNLIIKLIKFLIVFNMVRYFSIIFFILEKQSSVFGELLRSLTFFSITLPLISATILLVASSVLFKNYKIISIISMPLIYSIISKLSGTMIGGFSYFHALITSVIGLFVVIFTYWLFNRKIKSEEKNPEVEIKNSDNINLKDYKKWNIFRNIFFVLGSIATYPFILIIVVLSEISYPNTLFGLNDESLFFTLITIHFILISMYIIGVVIKRWKNTWLSKMFIWIPMFVFTFPTFYIIYMFLSIRSGM